MKDPRRIRGIYRISGGQSIIVCWCMYVCMYDMRTSQTCFMQQVLADEIAWMPEYKVSKQVSTMYGCMYVCMYLYMYVCLTAIIIFVACGSDAMYVNIYDCFYVCIRWL